MLQLRVSDTWRSYIVQKIMWRIGAHVAYSSPWVKRSKAVTDEKQIAVYDSLTEGLIQAILNMDLQCHDIQSCMVR